MNSSDIFATIFIVLVLIGLTVLACDGVETPMWLKGWGWVTI